MNRRGTSLALAVGLPGALLGATAVLAQQAPAPPPGTAARVGRTGLRGAVPRKPIARTTVGPCWRRPRPPGRWTSARRASSRAASPTV